MPLYRGSGNRAHRQNLVTVEVGFCSRVFGGRTIYTAREKFWVDYAAKLVLAGARFAAEDASQTSFTLPSQLEFAV
jgi:hypothetical protein